MHSKLYTRPETNTWELNRGQRVVASVPRLSALVSAPRALSAPGPRRTLMQTGPHGRLSTKKSVKKLYMHTLARILLQTRETTKAGRNIVESKHSNESLSKQCNYLYTVFYAGKSRAEDDGAQCIYATGDAARQ